MSYLILNTRGQLVATVANSSLNQQYDVDLIGKNYTNYGQAFNDNLYKLMENFASSTAPPKGVTGQLWFNTDNSGLYVNVGDQTTPNWSRVASGGAGGSGGPTNSQDLWIYANGDAGWDKIPEFSVDVNGNLRTITGAYIHVNGPNQTFAQQGLLLGALPKNQSATNSEGVITIVSDDDSFNSFYANLALITDPDTAQLRFSINAYENSVGPRNITLNENGGYVGIDTKTPQSELDVFGSVTISGTNRFIWSNFSDSIVSNRTLIQSNVQDSFTDVGITPNGAGGYSGLTVYSYGGVDSCAFAGLYSDSFTQLNTLSSNGTGGTQIWPLTFNTNGEAMRIMPERNVGINQTAPATTLHITSAQRDPYSSLPVYQKVGLLLESTYRSLGNALGVRVASDIYSPEVRGFSSKGNLDTPATTTINNTLLGLQGYGYDGFEYKTGSGITFSSSQAWAPLANGSDIRFYTTKNGTLQKTEGARINHFGNLGINDTDPVTKLTVKTPRLTNQGMRLSSDRNEWMRLMPDMAAGTFNPIVQQGDSGIIYGANAACVNQGFVIAPWCDQSGGLRLDSKGNFSFGNLLTANSGIQSGLWVFRDTNWSGVNELLPDRPNTYQGGFEYQDPTFDANFGISVKGPANANFYVEGGFRQPNFGSYNYFMAYSGFGTYTPEYMVDIKSDIDYIARFHSDDDQFSGVLLENKNYVWEYGVFGDNIDPTLAIAAAPANSFYIFDDNAGDIRVIITPDGNLGINTFAPQETLHVNGGNILAVNSTDTYLKLKAGTGIPRSTSLTHHGTSTNSYFAITSSDSAERQYSRLAKYDYTSNAWTFSTNNVDRLTITNNGGIFTSGAIGGGMGTGNINAKGYYIDGKPLQLGGGTVTLPYPITLAEFWNPTPQAGQGTYYWATEDSHNFRLYNTSVMHVALADNATHAINADNATRSVTSGTADIANALNPSNNYRVNSLGVGVAATGTTGEIIATNDITAFYSDQRLKTDIEPLEDALQKVNLLSGVTYRPNRLAVSKGFDDSERKVGVIAQEVQKVLPEAVKIAPFDRNEKGGSLSGEEYLTVQYDKLVPLLIESIKELTAKVQELESKIS